MSTIKKEEKINMGSGSSSKRLSSREKSKLLLDFMSLRANPEKNRAFQHIKALIEENKRK